MSQIESQSPRRSCPLCQAETTFVFCEADGMATLLLNAPPSRPDSVETGVVLGERYRVESILGHGGFGTVFAAQHVGTGQKVAVKALQSGGSTNQVDIRRFFQEARITAQLHHPNTVRVFDFGQADNGLLYLVMELLKGETLRESLHRRKKNLHVYRQAEAVDLGLQIASSLVEAHSAGLVHRDLKPDNIMLQQLSPSQTIVKVLDFGIAKVRDASLTQGPATFGTPYYMSPEQSHGHGLDGRSDIYALAVMLFELVSGRHPYTGDTPLSILYQHVNAEIPDVSALAKTSLTPAFIAVVERGMQKKADDRFQDAQEMCEALFRCMDTNSNAPLHITTPQQNEPTLSTELSQKFRRPATTDTLRSSGSIQPLVEPTGAIRTSAKRLQPILLFFVLAAGVLLSAYLFWSSPTSPISVQPMPEIKPRVITPAPIPSVSAPPTAVPSVAVPPAEIDAKKSQSVRALEEKKSDESAPPPVAAPSVVKAKASPAPAPAVSPAPATKPKAKPKVRRPAAKPKLAPKKKAKESALDTWVD